MNTSLENGGRPALLSFLKSSVSRSIAWCKENSLTVGCGILCLAALSGSATLSWQASRQGQAQHDRLAGMASMGLGAVLEEVSAGRVKSLVSHEVPVKTLQGKQSADFVEVILENGSVGAIVVAPEVKEKLWSSLVEASRQQEMTIQEGYKASRSIPYKRAVDLAAWVLFLLTMLLLLRKHMMHGASAMFKPTSMDRTLRLDDVAGYDEVKKQMRSVLDQMLNFEKYEAIGIKPPRGLVLTGDPGVGKSMLAKALANEVKADFFYCTASDFVEMYVGVGAKRVRKLFKAARKCKSAFIFIDELDAIGSRTSNGSDSERQATINQLLAEMDGVNENGRLLVMGATNHVDSIDPALLRPGRFDKKLHVPLPDLHTRMEILGKYLPVDHREPCVDMEGMAQRTTGFSGAQLRSVVNTARNLAMKAGTKVSMSMLEDAQEIALLGESRGKSEGKEVLRVAVHELGHALAGYLYCPDLYVEKVTTFGRGNALGYASSRPVEERALKTEEEILGNICMMLAGRAAESVILGSVSSGAMDDLSRANDLARKMVCHLGMGKSMGLATMPSNGDARISEVAAGDIKDILEEQYERAKNMVEQHREWFEQRTRELLDKGLLAHDALFSGMRPNA